VQQQQHGGDWLRVRGTTKGGATNLKVGGGVNALEGEGGGVNTGKTLKFEKGGGGSPPLPSSYGGTAPGSHYSCKEIGSLSHR